ncbi:unnamed protein product [Ambrosiozyma monospora]|uniref:Unnamed protein product n=1 Tax=Ambrosiozyma monospora TaxID=43982 RepID=A0A9W6WIH9_AMBMO|nr:unnamed protein product [Ambrosiozyma monospora]
MQVYYHHFHVLYRSAPDSVSSATTTTPTSPETDKFVTTTSLGTAVLVNQLPFGSPCIYLVLLVLPLCSPLTNPLILKLTSSETATMGRHKP